MQRMKSQMRLKVHDDDTPEWLPGSWHSIFLPYFSFGFIVFDGDSLVVRLPDLILLSLWWTIRRRMRGAAKVKWNCVPGELCLVPTRLSLLIYTPSCMAINKSPIYETGQAARLPLGDTSCDFSSSTLVIPLSFPFFCCCYSGDNICTSRHINIQKVLEEPQ